MEQRVRKKTLKIFLCRGAQAILWSSPHDSDQKQTNKKWRLTNLNRAKNTSISSIWISRVNWRLDSTEVKSRLLPKRKSSRKWIPCKRSKMLTATPRTSLPVRSLWTSKGTRYWFLTLQPPSFLSTFQPSRAPLTLSRDNGRTWE